MFLIKNYSKDDFKNILFVESEVFMEYRTLNNGNKIPMAIFGVYQITDHETCVNSVVSAIKVGYRGIDTAASYGNEKAVGEAIKKCIEEGIVTREELFVISKMWVQDMKNYEVASKAIETSLNNLGLDYLDLYLEHQAMGNYFEAYRAMEDAYKAGKLKAIGVSNFFPSTLVNFCENVEIVPAVNQVELHPWFAQNEALEVMKEYDIVPQAWASLAEGKHGIFTDADLVKIGEKYGKSPAQVALRWNIQRGVAVTAKSTKEERMKENLNIFDFELTDEEMNIISSKTLDHSEIINHFDPKLVKFLNNRNIHD